MDSSDAAGLNKRLPIALTIAGSDSGGGAGIQADLKTFAALGVYGASVVTALTAQNTRGVRRIHFPSPEMVADQIDMVLEDFNVAAIKIGMLGNATIAKVVAERLSAELTRQRRLMPDSAGEFIVYDPVMTASSGDPLSGASFVETVGASLLPLTDCLTPNLAEAAALLGEPVARSEADMARQGKALLKLGPRAVLVKGGHLDGDEAIDLLVTRDALHRFAAPRLLPKTFMEPAARCPAPSPPISFSGLRCRRPWRRPRRSCAKSIERGRDVTLGAGAGPMIQTELRSKL